jgi:hypothetical protein
MSRALFLSLDEGQVVARCLAKKVSISTIERLPAGGVRLVCDSVDGAGEMTRDLKKFLISDTATRQKLRPTTPLW